MLQRSSIFLGQYRPLDSFLHRLDARAKLAPVVLVMILALLTESYAFYAATLGVLVAALLASGIGAARLASSFRPVLYMVAITALYHLIFSERASQSLFEIFGFAITEGGARMAVFFSLRLLIFVSIAFLVTLTSSPSDLAEALTRLARPLSALKVPVNDLGLVLFMAIRFVPILMEEFEAIRNAQVIRGVDFAGGFFARIKKTGYLLVPVFMAALNRADDLALAMEARGYDGRKPRTFYTHTAFGTIELYFVMTTTAALLALFWGTR
ncbi:energy-coupling factor transporter transmembrane protein EcfT [bacterium]|nr:energy-coupling factor transporter transmembrane protein EcfT [bacterium]